MIYELTPDFVKQHPFITDEGKAAFYKHVFRSLTGKEFGTDETRIDCRNIDVSYDIQSEWYDYAKYHGIDQTGLTMRLAMSGPKVNHNLTGYQILIKENCIYIKDTPFDPNKHENKATMKENGIKRVGQPNENRLEELLISTICNTKEKSGTIETIIDLLSIGFKEDELSWLGFETDDIQEVKKSTNPTSL